MNGIEQGIGWLNDIRETGGRFGEDQLREGNIPRTASLLTSSAIILVIAGVMLPEGNIGKASAFLVAADNAGLATFLIMEGYGRLAQRLESQKPSK